MLLKSLKMQDFRQFRDESINFATDSHKNITIIMGENGAGKTTISQAFSWCLYGTTDFDDKSMLNKITASKMMPSEEKTVKVELQLVHSGIDYTITTEQTYRKDTIGKVKANNVVRNIAYKKDGQQEFIKPLEIDMTVKQILPQELSKYFFFDGERIGNMSKEIRKGKSQTFGQAVRGLLGLNALVSAIEHMKPNSKYGVIGSYDESYNDKSDSKIAQYTKEINEYQEKLDKIDVRLPEIENDIQLAKDRIDELSERIKESQEGEQLQNQKNDLVRKLAATQNSKKTTIDLMLKAFSKGASSYFSKSLIKKSLEILSENDLTNKDIPEMHAKTIDFLIKQGKCICGNKVEAGNDEYMELTRLLEFLPPKSIGIMVGQFVKDSESKGKSGDNVFDSFAKTYSLVIGQDNDIAEYKNDIKIIEGKLVDFKGTGHFQQELQMCERTVRERNTENNRLLQERGGLETLRERQITERAKLTIHDESNRKIEIYKAYAQYMYDQLQLVYSKNETIIREKLQTEINNMFKEIYGGESSLRIDEKYNVEIIVENYDDVEGGTAQSISVIFAFISAIIKLARASKDADSDDSKLLASEPYPLVMDAPLSAFDKRRIQTVCEALPNVAEQVIIFIKDTDGEIAEAHMSDKIGKRFVFDKNNEFETKLLEG